MEGQAWRDSKRVSADRWRRLAPALLDDLRTCGYEGERSAGVLLLESDPMRVVSERAPDLRLELMCG